MGTTWAVKLAAPDGIAERDVCRLVEECLASVVSEMSQWELSSNLSRYNRAKAGSWHTIPDGYFRVLTQALDIARATGGAYDPTIGPLTELWGFGASGRRDEIPDARCVEKARMRVGWRRLTIDTERHTLLQPGGVALDLASIAKGFAVDLVSETLSKQGFRDHLVEIGGELRGSGIKPDYSPWWVAIDDSCEEADETVVALHHLSIATSGDARRFIMRQGRRYSHTLDPRTGYPIAERLASVTVIDHSCMRADAFATALSVLGADDGFSFACERNLAATFVLRDKGRTEHRPTPAYAAMMTA
jgi:thiamine biosynthesis lipoprotein